MFRKVGVITGVMLLRAFFGPAVAAGLPQLAAGTAAAPATGEAVTFEPIECRWRTSTSAVRVGELFTLVLTCSVVETAATTVVPDQSRLDPGVLQMPPLEVVGGTQANDVRTGTRRFFQYAYTLRYVGEDFGKDLSLPALTVSYRVQSRVQQDAAVEGRERQYILPARTIRILSLVPAIATNIRDQPAETFRQIEARRFRASVLRVIAGSFYVVAALVAMSGVTRAVRRRRREGPAGVRLASDGAILRHVSGELDELRRARAVAGWTDALSARALAALRVVAAYVGSLPVTQARGRGIEPSDGQLVVTGRWPRRDVALVSASVASATGHLAELDNAMSRFTARVYGRDGRAIGDADLDEALDVGGRALHRLRREHTWLAQRLRAAAFSLGRLRDRS